MTNFVLSFMIGTWPAVFLAQRYPIEKVACLYCLGLVVA